MSKLLYYFNITFVGYHVLTCENYVDTFYSARFDIQHIVLSL